MLKRCNPLLACAALAAALLGSAPAFAARDWTRFRGPNGQGHAGPVQLPLVLKPSDFNWKVALPGVGHSSPVIWDDRLFLTGADPDRAERYLLCLSTEDGRLLWKQTSSFSKYQHHKFNSYASETPAVDSAGVYVAWGMPERFEALGFDHGGRPLWKRDLGPHISQHGSGASPITYKDLVIVANEQEDAPGMLVALDRKTGQTVWKIEREGGQSPYVTPAIYTPKDGQDQLIFTSTVYGMTSVDPLTGKLNWELRDLFQQRCVSSPVLVGNGLIVATCGQGGQGRLAVAVKAAPGPGKAPELAYSITRAIPYVPTAVMVKDLVFFWGDAGIVTCIKAATGEVVWSERVGGNYFGSPIVVGDRIYAIETRGQLVAIAASDRFKELGRSELGETSHATPAVDNGVMYLRTERHLISAGKKK